MCGIDSAELRGHTSQGNQFFGFGIGGGRIFQGGRNSHGALAHSLSHKFFHLVQLFWRGLLVVISQHHAANLGRAHVTAQIDSHALLFKPGEVLLKSSPVGSDVIVIVGGAVGLDDRIIERSGGLAFTGYLSRNALKDLRG